MIGMSQVATRIAGAVLVLGTLGGCDSGTNSPGFSPLGHAPVTNCTVNDVVDGDTISATCNNGGSTTMNLAGIDAPETTGAECAAERARGIKARTYLLRQITRAGRIQPVVLGTDSQNVPMVRILVDGRDVAELMIENGHARPLAGAGRTNWCEGSGATS